MSAPDYQDIGTVVSSDDRRQIGVGVVTRDHVRTIVLRTVTPTIEDGDVILLTPLPRDKALALARYLRDAVEET